MTKWADSKYLLSEQYKDAGNLQARIDIHARFSTNPQNLFLWIFVRFKMSPVSRILELGSGNGRLWKTNIHRLPSDWHVTLTDLSPGMLDEARRDLSASRRTFEFKVVDAQSIPFGAGAFDAVIANHMLYHVPDIDRALSEIRRVLKPGGLFYASTVGEQHMKELKSFVRRFVPEFQSGDYTNRFDLENGDAQLSKQFRNVRRHLHDDSLVITETAPLVAYVLSDGDAKKVLKSDKMDEFARAVETEIKSKGAFRVTKLAGMFGALS